MYRLFQTVKRLGFKFSVAKTEDTFGVVVVAMICGIEDRLLPTYEAVSQKSGVEFSLPETIPLPKTVLGGRTCKMQLQYSLHQTR